MTWAFDEGEAVCAGYGFGSRSNIRVPASSIETVFTGFAEWGIQVAGELFFVAFGEREALIAFARTNGLLVVEPFDRWSWLLEPYLDTNVQVPEVDQKLRLEGGLRQEVIDGLRARVGPAMWLYNFAVPLWESTNLSHTDLLRATRPGLVYPHDGLVAQLRLEHEIGDDPLFDARSSDELYRWSMEIAMASSGWDRPVALPQ